MWRGCFLKTIYSMNKNLWKFQYIPIKVLAHWSVPRCGAAPSGNLHCFRRGVPELTDAYYSTCCRPSPNVSVGCWLPRCIVACGNCRVLIVKMSSSDDADEMFALALMVCEERKSIIEHSTTWVHRINQKWKHKVNFITCSRALLRKKSNFSVFSNVGCKVSWCFGNDKTVNFQRKHTFQITNNPDHSRTMRKHPNHSRMLTLAGNVFQRFRTP